MPPFTGKTQALRANAASLQTECCYTLNGYLSKNGKPTEANLSTAIAKCYQFGYIDGDAKTFLMKVNTSANAAKHEWGVKFFKKFSPSVAQFLDGLHDD